MPDFTDPFVNNIPSNKLTKQELIRALRLDIAAEHEAICLYMAHAEATDNPLVREVLIDVANEEREHVGEFERLLEILAEDEVEWKEHGREEVNEIISKMGTVNAGDTEDEGSPDSEETTIGSLKD